MPGDRFFGPLDALRTLIAASDTFQSETGAVDAAAALAFVTFYSEVTDEPLSRPRAYVGSEGGRGIEKTSSTGWDMSGGLEFEFQRESDAGDVGNPPAGMQTFFGVVDAIIDDMATLCGSNGYLDATSFRLPDDPVLWLAEFNDGVEFWSVVVSVGVRGA